MALFLVHLHNTGYAPSTITTYTSAIGYIHKLYEQPDPSASFLIQKTLHALRKNSPQVDSRLPITITILKLLIAASDTVIGHYTDRILFKCMMTVAFFGFLRIGEITVAKNKMDAITLRNIQWDASTKSFSITLTNFKHSVPGKSHTIVLKSQTLPNPCPVTMLHNWLAIRPKIPGLLFTLSDGKGMKREWFDQNLRRCLSFCNLNTKLYKGHSFRIGAATHASLSLGYTDSQIRLLGRWKTDAFKKYIRNPSM